MPKFRLPLAALLASLLASVLAVCGAADASAAARFTQVVSTVSVSGTSVTASVQVSARVPTDVSRYTVCVRPVRPGASFEPLPGLRDTVITTTGTMLTQTATLTPGTYDYWPCVRASWWYSVGAYKRFTVREPEVLFSDDFSGPAGPALAGSRSGSAWTEWSTETYNPTAAYGQIRAGAASRTALDGQGHLVITARPTVGTSISTKDHFSFTTGTLETRVYVQGNTTGPGYWPAVWTLNNHPGPNRFDADHIGEVDLMEAYTGLAGWAHIATHNYDTTPPNDFSRNWSGAGDPVCGYGQVFDQWLTVKAVIEPDTVTFFYNGVQCGPAYRRSEQSSKPYGLFPDVDRGNWVILSLAIGGAYGQQDGMARGTGKFYVDYVKVTRNADGT